MSENEITLVKTSSGELVETGTTKLEVIENKLSEVEINLANLADHSATAVAELVELAKAAQNPQYYEALAKLIVAAAKANHEAVVAITAKSELYNLNKGNGSKVAADDPDEGKVTNITQNNLVMTTTELLQELLKEKKRKEEE